MEKHNWQPLDWLPKDAFTPAKDVYKCTKCLRELTLNQHSQLPKMQDCPGEGT
jgi:hypothetical protein